MQKKLLVLREAMHENDEGIAQIGIVLRRQVNIEITLLGQGRRPEAIVFAVIRGEVDESAGEAPIHRNQLVAILDPTRPGMAA